ncbi:enoyl-CoA hydratase-related protein [Mycolicibacterium goodii]|uniref:Probable enoyl-CoA hydratase EchA17 n=1 Tax=Mycolicibacterium goodii TaxID=134601 RepID=A0A0K0XFC2_MYCGD|nr:enoyl-CoA hydratase [Mycolicibacterium goodii]
MIRLARPDALNALNQTLEAEVLDAAVTFDADSAIGAILVTGSERAFAAGADIAELVSLTPQEARARKLLCGWDALAQIGTPVIAAVSGYALGGGCELAMLCDLVIAADTARFGQPEITLGILPGLGGTQRLTRAIGKAKAMDLCLTGRSLTAEEAEKVGLVSRVVPADALLQEALAVAQRIAGMSRPAGRAVKDAINNAFDTTLTEGMRYEREAFYALFDTHDQTEGMTAFLEKRPPRFTDR